MDPPKWAGASINSLCVRDFVCGFQKPNELPLTLRGEILPSFPSSNFNEKETHFKKEIYWQELIKNKTKLKPYLEDLTAETT